MGAGTEGCPKAEVEPNADVGAVDAAAKGDATAGAAPNALGVEVEAVAPKALVAAAGAVAPNALVEAGALAPNAPPAGFAPKALAPNPPPAGAAPNADPEPNADAGFAACPNADCPKPVPGVGTAVEAAPKGDAEAGGANADVPPNALEPNAPPPLVFPNADCPKPDPAGGTVVTPNAEPVEVGVAPNGGVVL